MKTKFIALLTLISALCFSTFAQLNLDWVHHFGDSTVITNGAIYCAQICTDPQGNILMTGSFEGNVDFDPSPGGTAILNSACTSRQFFLVKYTDNGSLLWARQFTCSPYLNNQYNHCFAAGLDLKTDISGNIYVCGDFSLDLITQIQGNDTSWIVSDSGEMPAFFAKYNSNGNLIWSKNLDCTHGAHGCSINVDPSGFVYLFGQYDEIVDLDPGPNVYNIHGNYFHGNGYLAKYDTAGNFIWGTCMRGGNNWTMHSALNSHGNLTITGFYSDSLSFPYDPQFTTLYPNSHTPDGYIIQFTKSGHIKWIKNFSLGSPLSGVEPCNISIDSRDNIILSGAYTDTVDFNPPLGGATHIAGATVCESFFAKYDSMGNYLWSNVLHGDFQNFVAATALSLKDDIYLTGYYYSHCDMDASNGVFNLSNSNGSNYIAKYTTNGNFLWATELTSDYIIQPASIYSYGTASVYLSGYFKGTVDFDLNAGTYNVNAPLNTEYYGFLVKYLEYYNGIEENATYPQITLYPNPAKNELHINTTHVLQYEVFNSLSAKVIPLKKYEPSDVINISNFSPGVYFLHLLSPGNQTTTLKFIKLPE